MATVTICSDFGAQKNKVWHCFPIYFPWSDGTGCHVLYSGEMSRQLVISTVDQWLINLVPKGFLTVSYVCEWAELRARGPNPTRAGQLHHGFHIYCAYMDFCFSDNFLDLKTFKTTIFDSAYYNFTPWQWFWENLEVVPKVFRFHHAVFYEFLHMQMLYCINPFIPFFVNRLKRKLMWKERDVHKHSLNG